MGLVRVDALRGIDLEISRGEFVSIVGPSGSGKSTLMNLCGCLDLPTEGVVRLEGEDIAGLSESELATIRGQKIGFVFQKFNLLSTLSAVENVELPLIFQGIGKDERNAAAVKYLERVGLGHRVEHRPNELSGGEQQRVAIARALAVDPEFILADEPTGNLDSKSGASVLDLLRELHGEGKTLVVVTHDVSVAKQAERTIRIRDGLVEKGGLK
ncbi:macrolide ABC transporter ATP-binding protein [Candidatus Micrarchaeota archaeon CG1_02_55_22]|nr:MAG: macrolide ABC transporter ATP-binding protein [Candidatus Micrarchaeota archaeon CG1_02_55_22]